MIYSPTTTCLLCKAKFIHRSLHPSTTKQRRLEQLPALDHVCVFNVLKEVLSTKRKPLFSFNRISETDILHHCSLTN